MQLDLFATATAPALTDEQRFLAGLTVEQLRSRIRSYTNGPATNPTKAAAAQAELDRRTKTTPTNAGDVQLALFRPDFRAIRAPKPRKPAAPPVLDPALHTDTLI